MVKGVGQNFEGFKGLSYRSSNLTRSPNYAIEAKNVKIGKPYRIEGETGFKIKAQPKTIFGLHTYNYQDKDGVTKEELIGINEMPWRLKRENISLTYSGTEPDTSASWSMLVDETVADRGFVLTITVDDQEILAYGTAEVGNDGTLYDFKTQLEAASSPHPIAVSIPNAGIVNGTQSTVGQVGTPIVVDSGHTFQVGTWVELTPSGSSNGTVRYLTEVTSTTIAWSHGAGINVTDNQKLGNYNLFVEQIPITVSSSLEITDPAGEIPFDYWQPISSSNFSQIELFRNFFLAKTGQSLGYPLTSLTQPSEVPNASFADMANCCFIAAGGLQQICKYDGNSVYKAGLPSPESGFGANVGPITSDTGTGITGTYKHKISYIHKDNRGNIIESVLSPASTALTVSNKSISVEIEPINPGNSDEIGYNEGCAKVNGLQTGVTTITVDAGHSLRVGDTAYFYDSLTSEYVERLVEGITYNSITIDGSNVNVADNSIISANLRVGIYRTLNGGTDEYYLVAEIPHNSIDNTQSYTDSTTDANLGAQYIDPDPITKQPHLPPYAKYITVHGRLLVAAEGLSPATFGGSQYLPDQFQMVNAISWSDAVLGPEAWPLVNQEKIPNKSKSAITGIASDVDSILLIFKEDCINTFIGEMDANLTELTEISRGSYGVSSHNSIEKVSVSLASGEVIKATMGLGRFGVVCVYAGKIIKDFTQELKGKFQQLISTGEHENCLYRLSEGAFNPNDSQYAVSLPKILPLSSGNYILGDTDLYTFDTEENSWTRQNYDDDIEFFDYAGVNQMGGIATYDNQFHFVSHFNGFIDGTHGSYLFAKHDPALGKYAYAANTKKITQDFIPQWDLAGNPTDKKEWKQLAVFSFQSSDEFIPFDLRVRTYRNWEDPFTATPSTDYTINFTSASQVEECFNLVAGTNAKVMLFRFTVSTLHQRLNITGYSPVVSFSMMKDLVKK